MPKNMKPEVFDARLGTYPIPCRLNREDGERVSLAAHDAQPFVAVDGNVGENKLRVVAL